MCVYEFSQASALAMSELFKLGLSAVLYVSSLDRKCESVRSPASFLNELWTIVNDFRTSVSPTLLRNISLLSFSYAVNNHLAFYAFLLASPGTIQLVKSGSTFLTAFILFFILSRPISQLQWIAMAIQMLGLVQFQYNECKQTVAAPLVGYIILLVQVTMTAANGAYNDHVTKTAALSLHAINILLYFTGFLFNNVAFLIKSIGLAGNENPEPGFFEGYSFLAILVVVLNSLMGIVITAVYKYADAIVKSVATTFSTAILLLLSAALFSAPISYTNAIGVCNVFVATYIYMRYPASETSAPVTGDLERGTASDVVSRKDEALLHVFLTRDGDVGQRTSSHSSSGILPEGG
ncbi:nucleotide-sugar transporter-domain-containing protein [Hyaloraphidium curvatum]|nr:nucleotide-sugar transporter-domain-containing protein [Hyaloraphidium curvatum]